MELYERLINPQNEHKEGKWETKVNEDHIKIKIKNVRDNLFNHYLERFRADKRLSMCDDRHVF